MFQLLTTTLLLFATPSFAKPSAKAIPPSALVNFPAAVVTVDSSWQPDMEKKLGWKAESLTPFLVQKLNEAGVETPFAKLSGKELDDAITKRIEADGSIVNVRFKMMIGQVEKKRFLSTVQTVVNEQVQSFRKKGPVEYFAAIYQSIPFPFSSPKLPEEEQMKLILSAQIEELGNQIKAAKK